MCKQAKASQPASRTMILSADNRRHVNCICCVQLTVSWHIRHEAAPHTLEVRGPGGGGGGLRGVGGE